MQIKFGIFAYERLSRPTVKIILVKEYQKENSAETLASIALGLVVAPPGVEGGGARFAALELHRRHLPSSSPLPRPRGSSTRFAILQLRRRCPTSSSPLLGPRMVTTDQPPSNSTVAAHHLHYFLGAEGSGVRSVAACLPPEKRMGIRKGKRWGEECRREVGKGVEWIKWVGEERCSGEEKEDEKKRCGKIRGTHLLSSRYACENNLL